MQEMAIVNKALFINNKSIVFLREAGIMKIGIVVKRGNNICYNNF